MKKKMLISLGLAMFLVLGCFSSVALADEHPLSGGTLDISTLAPGDTVRVASGASVTFSGSNTDIQIICEAGAQITLSGLVINNAMSFYACPLSFTGEDNTLTLAAGTVNSLTAGDQQPAVRVEGLAKLTIQGAGTLNATGGSAAAGIGGGIMGDCGTIEIKGGTISATVSTLIPGIDGAGIGGGAEGGGGTVIISGGTVYARGGDNAAGIGGGGNISGGAEAGSVTITGGVVTAEGYGIADIGGAGGGTLSVDGGARLTLSRMGTNATVTLGDCYITDDCTYPAEYVPITDGYYIDGTLYTGTIIDVASESGGPGYTFAGHIFFMSPGTYLITGTTTEHLLWTEVNESAMTNLIFYNVSIEGADPCFIRSNADIRLVGENWLTSIGNCPGLHCPAGFNMLIHGSGSLTATGGSYSAAIGGGQNEGGGAITISGGTITANGSEEPFSTGIGGGSGDSSSARGANITISGGTVTATGCGGAGIGTGYNDLSGPTIHVTGGTVTATDAYGGAGIGSGKNSVSGTISISGGTVTAGSEGIFGGAGIGGGSGCSGGNIQISGTADVTATGGIGGAGIGGGNGGGAGTINISGGTVSATGRGTGGMMPPPGGAGIGGGTAADGGSITISGGILTATGTENGAGIGSAYFGRNIDITITGGIIYASGSDTYNPDIGCFSGGSLAISGDAAVFGRRNIYSPVTTSTHTHITYSEDTDESFGFAIPAAWTPVFGSYIRIYTLSYDVNRGSGTAPGSVTKLYNGTTAVAGGGVISRTGYSFAGWNTAANGGGTSYAEGSTFTFTSPATLYAQWEPNTYTVVYNANGGEGTTSGSSHIYDTARNLTLNGFSRTGYSFAGWALTSGGSALYTDGQSVTNLTNTDSAAVTLYAQWNAHTYTVEYKPNGGAGTMAGSAFIYGVSGNLRQNAFTREGYTFDGWASAAGSPVIYTDGQNVSNLTDANGGTVTLYARWTAHPGLSSSVSGKIYIGGRFVLTPNIDGGTWDWDGNYLSATFNSPATFTGLKEGTTRVTYTVEGVSAYYDISIEKAALPETGQDGTLIFILGGAGLLALMAAVLIRRCSRAR